MSDDTTQDISDLHITMQPRCPMCLSMQKTALVRAFSYAEIRCHRCGQHSTRMTRAEYIGAISRAQRLRPEPMR